MNDAENAAAWAHVHQLAARNLSKTASLPELSRGEAKCYSITRMVRSMLTGNPNEAGLEREVSAATAKAAGLTPRATSFFMPSSIKFKVPEATSRFERAAYAVGASNTGGALVQTELRDESFIEVLRNQTVVGQLGARFLTGLVGTLDLPRQTTQTNTYWVGESVALTESEATFDKVSLTPKTVGALSKMSRLMSLQATPAVEQLVRDDLAAVLGLAIDAGALSGTGTSSQPRGIINTSGIGSVVMGSNGGNASFDAMISLYAAPLAANAPQANLAYAINAKTKGYLTTLKSSTGQYLWNPTQSVGAPPPDSLVGYKYAVSNQLPANLTKGTSNGICSAAIFGNWQELLIGEWGVTEIMVNPYDSTGFANGDVLIRAFQTIDVALRHPASFAVVTDLLTPGF